MMYRGYSTNFQNITNNYWRFSLLNAGLIVYCIEPCFCQTQSQFTRTIGIPIAFFQPKTTIVKALSSTNHYFTCQKLQELPVLMNPFWNSMTMIFFGNVRNLYRFGTPSVSIWFREDPSALNFCRVICNIHRWRLTFNLGSFTSIA